MLSFYSLQTGGYTTANLIWDMMQARNITPAFPAVQAYYDGLKVCLLADRSIGSPITLGRELIR